jgi:hypothetical protein
MKHILITLFCITSFFSTTSALAANKVGLAVDQGLGIVGKFDDINALTGNDMVSDDYINAFIGNAGLSVDYIFQQGRFSAEADPLEWYFGGGVYYNWANRDNVGVRMPLGLTLPFESRWDAYVQLSPALGFKDNDVALRLDFAIGIRYEF